MLWYKTWLETRTRFLIGAITLAWVGFMIVMTHHGNRMHADPPMSYVQYIWKAVHHGYVHDLFTILVIVLGGGGLLQEQAHGTAGFTLALPVSRARLIWMRVAVGFAEVIFLALVPALVIPAISPLMGEHYPLNQALQFSLLWSAGGTIIFGAAVFLSTVLASEYSSWIVCFLCMMGYGGLVNYTVLQKFPLLDLFKLTSGSRMQYFDSTRYLLTGPLPWVPMMVIGAIAASLIFAANRLTQKQEY